MSEKKEEKKPSIVDRAVRWVTDAIRFVTYDIWRITDSDISGPRRVYIYLAKTLILAIRGYQRNDLQTRASALTYSTLLSVVPMLAVVVGVASGFGMKDLIEESLYDSFPSQSAQISRAFDFAQNYLSMTRGGVFLGIGLVLLLYTVFSLISTVEHTFNSIWQVEKDRTWHRKVTAYSAMIIILPVLMTVSSGLSIFLSTLRRALLSPYIFLTPIADTTLGLLPYTIIILFFTLLYLLAPNTRVRFLNALVAGTLVGCAFQIFQYLYINGQIWVSKYNAIYGSFAALPLLMLWLQLSWVICLFGAELVHASQSVRLFSFEPDVRNVSRRYRDFLALLICSVVAKRFERCEKPYTADELSDLCHIPPSLTAQTLAQLTELEILASVRFEGDSARTVRYQPAFAIGHITVGLILRRIDEHGSERFPVDIAAAYRPQWEALLRTRRDLLAAGDEVLVKDL